MGLHKFHQQNGRYPKDEEEVQKAQEYACEAANNLKMAKKEPELYSKTARYADCQISPVCSFIGGIVA